MLLSLLGLFPYSMKFKTKHSCVIVQRSIYINSLCAISMIIIIIAFLALHIRGIIRLTDGNSLTDAIMTQTNYILEMQTLTFVCLMAYYCAFLHRYKYVNIMNTLASLWIQLPSTENNILKNLKQSVIKILFTLMFLLLLQIAVNLSRHDGLWKKILVSFSFNIPQMIQFIVLAFYYTLILTVIAVLQKIESRLKYLTEDRKNNVNCFIKVHGKYSEVDLRCLELVFVKVFNVKRNINEAFQGPILFTTVQCFHSMVSEAHIIYHGVLIHQVLNTHEIVNCSIWIVYQILKIYILAYSGNLLKNEVGNFIFNLTQSNEKSSQQSH
jgi:hypothetical protein